MFEIITKSGGQWVSDQVGDPNVFATHEEAEAAIVELRKLGEDWANAEYDVREILTATETRRARANLVSSA